MSSTSLKASVLVALPMLVLALWTSAGLGAQPLPVVTTLFPYADMVRQIGGDAVSVSYLLPAGASPHTFEPRPSQIREAAKARLIIINGAGLDEWALKLAAAANPDASLVVLADGVTLRPYRNNLVTGFGEQAPGEEENREPGDHDQQGPVHRDHGHQGHAHHDAGSTGSVDPHFWLDPLIVRDEIAPQIAAALSRLAPEHTEAFQSNLARYQAQLSALDEEIRAAVSSFSQRRFISYHSAWGYFAHRYGLTEAATVAGFPGQEPSPRWLAQLVQLTRQLGVRVVFAEPQLSPRAAQAIAAEIGGQVVIMDPLGGDSLEGRDTYVNLLRFNLEALRQALR